MRNAQNIQALLNQIQTTIGLARNSNLSSASAGHDIFEAYIFSLVVEAAQIEGATVTYESVNGNNANQITFRTSPGYIFSTAHDYTHAVISFRNKPPLEVHLGIFVSGKSNVLHECDIAVVDRAEAQACRISQISPRASRVHIAVECKFYTSTPQLGLGRGFLGLQSDLSKDCFFVLNLSAPSIERLLSHRLKHRCRESVVPANIQSVNLLLHSFQSTFHEYKR